MKRFLFAALAALTLLFLAGCAAKPVEPETAEYYLTDEDVPLDERALSRAVPDFLTEEQQTLYRQAAALYDAMFGGETTEHRLHIPLARRAHGRIHRLYPRRLGLHLHQLRLPLAVLGRL
ncbi:MAG: hypothetical protein ACLSHJ_10335 [Oscillospiraceae bacterium]